MDGNVLSALRGVIQGERMVPIGTAAEILRVSNRTVVRFCAEHDVQRDPQPGRGRGLVDWPALVAAWEDSGIEVSDGK